MDVKPAQISLKGCNELQTERAGPAELGALRCCHTRSCLWHHGEGTLGAAEGFWVPGGFLSSGVRQGVAGNGDFSPG